MEPKEVRKRLQPLLDRYRQNEGDATFLKNEKQVCQSLIVPFIRDVLGWTTEDPSEFKAEESQSGKRIDYCVYNQGISQFIVEAKAPSRDIFDDAQAYTQALAYGYGKDHDFAILTNFRQIVILAPKIKYRVPEEAEIAKIDILAASDEDINLLLLFEKQFWVSKGKDNPLYTKLIHHKKQIPVDERLLDDMKNWRVILLKNIKKKNTNLDFNDEKEFTHVEDEVQKFIDRLIFICYCEDKELKEPELKALMNDKKDRYAMKPGWLLGKIQDVFEKYRLEYDSDLFDKSLANRVTIDDVELLTVLEDLREPKGKPAYDFKSMEADILGKTYENFIGHIQSGKKIKEETEDKGKRKKEGIYYTPKYIVDYIVNNTVRKFAKGKSYADILKIKIVDPACGSGSFLIRAFDILVEEASKAKKKGLSYEEKKELMLSCIHGVDVDERAAEIAKLNLSLRLAERGKKLPLLRDNIRNGDSLIDNPDVVGYKAFVWKEEFKNVFDGDGFDIVIGNPPYVRQEEISKYKKSFEKYEVYSGSGDIYTYFFEKGLGILKEGGMLSFIVSSKFVKTRYGENTRKYLVNNADIIQFIDFGDLPVFQDATTYPCVIVLSKNPQASKSKNKILYTEIRSLDFEDLSSEISRNKREFEQETLSSSPWSFSDIRTTQLKKKIEKDTISLIEYTKGKMFTGIKTGLNEAFVIDEDTKEKLVRENSKNAEIIKPFIPGRGIKRYNYLKVKSYLIFVPWHFPLQDDKSVKNASKKAEREFQKQYSSVYAHLQQFKEKLQKRNKVETGIRYEWYALQRYGSLYYHEFSKPKIMFPDIATENRFTFDDEGFFCGNTAYIIPLNDKYLLGVLNSKVIEFYFKQISTRIRGGFYRYISIYVQKIPMKKTVSDVVKKQIEKSVNDRIKISKEIDNNTNKTDSKYKRLEQQAKKIDAEIDELVYKIYGITDAEKKIIESSIQ